jgi:hypothetical protein
MTRSQRCCVLLAAVAWFAVGCYRPNFEDCTKTCTPEIQCPGGLECVKGWCTAGRQCGPSGIDVPAPQGDGPDADASPDGVDGGGADGDGGPDAPKDTRDDMKPDAPRDTPDDVEPDAPKDTPDDVEPDAPKDTPDDVEPDAPKDTPDDVEPDDPKDIPDDPPSDMPPDIAADLPDDSSDGHVPDVIGDTPTETPPWTPGMIPNLVLWLEADRDIEAFPGASVRGWRDQSAEKNHARQFDQMLAPTLVTNAVNGAPAVEFTGNTWMAITDAPSMRWGFGDFLLLILYQSVRPCSPESCYQQMLFHKTEVADPYPGPSLILQATGRVQAHISHLPQGPGQDLFSKAIGYDDGRPHLIGVRRSSNQLGLLIDGVDTPGPPAQVVVNVDALGSKAYFGAHGIQQPPDEFSFYGYISAIIGIKGAISAPDLAALESYLMTKYGIAPN